ncbi:MAG: hypothetical protein PHV17_05005 [Candidatus Omnitrophica bacterium]|nr:hypothetical protein [Candidatus Omnitrophota bacterium]
MTEGALFSRNNPWATFEISIVYLGNDPVYDTAEYKKKFLDNTKSKVIKELKSENCKWLFAVDKQFFGEDGLMITYGDEVMQREVYVVKNYRLYSLSFGCEKEYFDTQWYIIESLIKRSELLP